MTNANGQASFDGYTVVGREMVGGLLTVKMVRNDPYPIEAWHAVADHCLKHGFQLAAHLDEPGLERGTLEDTTPGAGCAPQDAPGISQ